MRCLERVECKKSGGSGPATVQTGGIRSPAELGTQSIRKENARAREGVFNVRDLPLPSEWDLKRSIGPKEKK